MKRIVCLLLFLTLSFACRVPTFDFQDANVIMKLGPIYRVGQYALFDIGRAHIYIEGLVQNVSPGIAKNVKITIWLYDSSSKLLVQDWTILDPPDLLGQQIGTWQIVIWDSDNEIKSAVDQSKIKYNITWE